MKPPAALAILLAVAGCAHGAAVPRGDTVLAEDFERGGGRMARTLIADPRLTIAPGAGVGGGDALRAAYIGGPMGSERMVRLIPLGESGLDYTLSYDVRFADGFQFVQGGKLHGLGPARPVAGGKPMRPDGWSARVMWRQGGHAELYTYHQDQRDRYGDHGEPVRSVAFAPGTWHAVSLHVRVNAPATVANGSVRLYVDGQLVERQERVRLRATEGPDTLTSRFVFSTFHGGNDPDWAPRTPDGGYATVHALFDNIAVSRGERVRAVPGG